MSSRYRDRKAATAPFVESLPALVELAISERRACYGWVGGIRFCVAYPGGRTIHYPTYKIETWRDITEVVAEASK